MRCTTGVLLVLIWILKVDLAAATLLRVSHNQTLSHPVHEALKYMAARVAFLSNNDLIIKIYPNGMLGSQRESIELLKSGALDMAKSSANEMEVFDASYGALNMPYIFRDRDHYYRVITGIVGKKILESSVEKGFFGLTFYDAGSRHFYANKPIRKPGDLNGLKIRVQPGQSSVRMLLALGASPAPIDFGELYTALQQGVVDGAENNINSFMASRHSDVARYFSLSYHTSIPDVLLISSKSWNKLNERQQSIIKQAARESTLEMRHIWQRVSAGNMEAAKKAGIKFIETQRSAFTEKTKVVYEQVRKNRPDVYSLIRAIEEQ